MEKFTASTQYKDFEGTAAADGQQGTASVEWDLREKGLISEAERIVAIELYTGEDYVHARAYVADENSQALKQNPVPVREVELDDSLKKFSAMFKRFSVVLTPNHDDLTGREYVVTNRKNG